MTFLADRTSEALTDGDIEHLDFDAPEPQLRRPQSDREFVEGTGVDTTGMTYNALRAFATAYGLSKIFSSNEAPQAVRELAENPTIFNQMVLIGLHHYNQPHEFATGVE